MQSVLRQSFAALPYQLSHFDCCHEAAAYLGLASHMPSGRLDAHFDEDGNLLVDVAQLKHLAAFVSDRMTDDWLETLKQDHQARLRAANDVMETPWPSQDTLTEAGLVTRLVDVGEAVAALTPYALVTKVLPDALGVEIDRRLVEAVPPPSPSERRLLAQPEATESAHLADRLLTARLQLFDLGYASSPGSNYGHSIPSTARPVVEEVARRYVGFGPRQWEVAGFETPAYVWQAVEAHFARFDAARLRQMARQRDDLSRQRKADRAELDRKVLNWDPSYKLSRLVESVRYWTAYVEIQTVVLRKAFYLRLLPALRALAAHWVDESQLQNRSDVLFLQRAEIGGGPRPSWAALIRSRREAYLRNVRDPRYPEIAPGRLEELLKDSG